MVITALSFVAAGCVSGRERKTAGVKLKLEKIFVLLQS